MSAKNVVTIVLAAGAGKRLGGPKALLAWPGPKGEERPLAIAHAEERLAAESRRVLVVTRRPTMMALLPFVRPGIDLLASDAADDLGPAGSLAFAVPRLGDAEIAIVTPVDTPPAKAETVARLLGALAEDPALLAARPVAHGRAGHPVALRRAALARYAEPFRPPPPAGPPARPRPRLRRGRRRRPGRAHRPGHAGRRHGHPSSAAALLQVMVGRRAGVR